MDAAKTVYLKRAIQLSWFTIGYNVLEGLVSVYFGLEKESLALAGFGLDSFIEVASAVVVLWRFQSEMGKREAISLDAERRAVFVIGLLFVALGILTTAGCLVKLAQRAQPETVIPGILVSVISLTFMFYLWRSKKNVAAGLDSATMMKDADCSLVCIKLSTVLLGGSLVFFLLPSLWWADSVAGLVLAILIGKEGVEAVQASRHENFSGGCGCSHCE
ncbi:MAG: heavy metal transporter [Elusimicrobia bacterium]|nr:heavy metal transporter [Elusimicrobiota bacterium]